MFTEILQRMQGDPETASEALGELGRHLDGLHTRLRALERARDLEATSQRLRREAHERGT